MPHMHSTAPDPRGSLRALLAGTRIPLASPLWALETMLTGLASPAVSKKLEG